MMYFLKMGCDPTPDIEHILQLSCKSYTLVGLPHSFISEKDNGKCTEKY